MYEKEIKMLVTPSPPKRNWVKRTIHWTRYKRICSIRGVKSNSSNNRYVMLGISNNAYKVLNQNRKNSNPILIEQKIPQLQIRIHCYIANLLSMKLLKLITYLKGKMKNYT